ncbi:MAG TPA: POTRA domain-containing protein, partial [Ignavibacteriaceae bacterium]|nr:POTRA domain-containing protein [Ignavibacteriaceae bacterium]
MLKSFLKKLFPVLAFSNLKGKIILLIIILSGIAAAQENKTVSYKILGISVEGNKTTDASTIIASSGLKIGDEIQIPGEQSLDAIRKLYALNIFYDIQIVIEKHVADGVFLSIKVQEFPRVEKVVIEGNDEISTDDIEKKISFTRGAILKSQEIASLKIAVRKLYEDDGYLNAKIEIKRYTYYTADTTDDAINVIWRNEKDLSDEYTLKYEKDEITYSNLIGRIRDRILLKMVIQENDKVIVRKIEFKGNKAYDDGDLKGEMDNIEESKWWKFWSSAKFDKKKYEDDKKKIIDYYKKEGYRDAEIVSDSLIYSNDNKDLEIVMNVFEGPQYKVRNIIWSGNSIYPEELLNDRLDFKKGDIFNYDKYEKNLRGNEQQNSVSDLYLDNGYLTFNLKPSEIKVDDDSVDLYIKLEERNQFRIGKVDIKGNDKTKDKVIRRELYTIPGDYYNKALLLRSVQQLANLQYFNVEKLYGPGGIEHSLPNDSTVNITFNVEEKSSDYLNASVGYSGYYGFSGAVGVTL